jgi:hypothetical protein
VLQASLFVLFFGGVYLFVWISLAWTTKKTWLCGRPRDGPWGQKNYHEDFGHRFFLHVGADGVINTPRNPMPGISYGISKRVKWRSAKMLLHGTSGTLRCHKYLSQRPPIDPQPRTITPVMVVGDADAMHSDAHMLRVIRHTHTKTRSRSHTRWAQSTLPNKGN